jgi:hypothetical protein
MAQIHLFNFFSKVEPYATILFIPDRTDCIYSSLAIKTEPMLPKIQKWPIFNHEYLANYYR